MSEVERPPRGALCGKYLPARYFFALFSSFAMGIIYMLRVNLGVAIIAMVNHTAIAAGSPSPVGDENTSSRSDCQEDFRSSSASKDGPFLWDGSQQGLVLSSYFWGYLVSQIPGGRLAEVFSGKWVMFGAVLINIICTFLTPLLAQLHFTGILVLRILQGVAGGVSFPCMHVLLSHWAPPQERSVISSISYAGTSLGTVLSMLATGLIADAIDWECAFYIPAGFCSIWLFIWIFFIYDSPKRQPFISAKEREYIEESLHPGGVIARRKVRPVPWKSVLRSMPFWAICIGHICNNWGWYMVLIELPAYMKDILNLKLSDNALYSSLPFFTMWFFMIILSKIIDSIKMKGIISNTAARKICTLIGTVVPSLCMVALCFIGCRPALGIALTTIAVTGSAGYFVGLLLNHMDIAPNFAGTLMGITNSAATVSGILVPIFVGWVTQDNHTIGAWQIIFGVTIGFYVLEICIFMIFASGEIQPWNDYDKEEEEVQKKKLKE